MLTAAIRALSVAALGAVAGAASLVFAFMLRPGVTLDFDRDLPRNVTGFYAPEYVPGGETFAWTGRSAKLNLPGLDRRVAWACTVRFRGGRSAGLEQPVLDVGVDGLSQATRAATNTFEDLDAAIPALPQRSGVVLTLTSSATFVPGPGDTRELGVQVDRLACRPVARTIAFPPRRADIGALVAGAIFGAALGAIGITPGSAAAATILVCAAQAFPLSWGTAPYSTYVDRVPWLAFWIAAAMVVTIKGLEWPGRPALRQTARFAVAFSASVLYLKLLGLLHPSKPLIDAVFQAHRLEAVLAGRYFFTQLMPSGVQFPYAIGLYVFSAPWAALTRDHVTLLRIVVCAVECVAGGLLYPVVARTWGDRLAAAIAVALFMVVPIGYWVVGNANLTNAFGQSIALIAVAAVILGSRTPVTAPRVVLWTVVIALALLSHVSTFATLIVTLAALVVLYWSAGGGLLRRPAAGVAIVTAVAVVFSVAIYYGHFGDVYRNALRVRGAPAAASATSPAGEAPAPPPARSPAHGRTAESFLLIGQSLGWPILLLAGAGAWSVARRRSRDPLTLALVAWGVAFAVFLGVGLMPVEPQFERYSLEFISRVAYAAAPAAVILAAAGATWAWRSGVVLRVLAIVLLVLAVAGGLREWAAWR